MRRIRHLAAAYVRIKSFVRRTRAKSAAARCLIVPFCHDLVEFCYAARRFAQRAFPLLRPVFVIMILLFSATLPSLADLSGTVTLAPNSTFDLTTGSLVSSYPDFRWDGNILRVQMSAVLIPGASASSATNLFASMTEREAQDYLQSPGASFVNSITPAANTMFVAWTNTAVIYPSKVLVTAVSNGSITLEYYTYDYTTGPPGISAVLNNSSLFEAEPLPNSGVNSGVAPSSIIVITGSRLSDPNVPLQLQDTTQGLPLTLNGTSLSVTVNGTTVQLAIYYATPTQVAAELPAATPVGSGTITVNHGGFSTSSVIQIVPSAYGIDISNGSAVAQDASSYALITYTASAQPGETITVWGTGLGSDTADSDTTYTSSPHPINTPVQVYVANVPATNIAYAGASVYPGVDVIVFTIPQGVPNGCAVPIAVVTGGSMLSNTPTLPIMNDGGVCSDPQYGTNGVLLSQSAVNSAALTIYESVSGGSLLGPPTTGLDATATIQQVSGPADCYAFPRRLHITIERVRFVFSGARHGNNYGQWRWLRPGDSNTSRERGRRRLFRYACVWVRIAVACTGHDIYFQCFWRHAGRLIYRLGQLS